MAAPVTRRAPGAAEERLAKLVGRLLGEHWAGIREGQFDPRRRWAHA